jgi:hypothetical protein
MPLTKKGEKIMHAMKERYGEEKGEQVFYASKNKGTISGVEKNYPTGSHRRVRHSPEMDEIDNHMTHSVDGKIMKHGC